MGSFSIWHWVVVLVIVMLVFGTKKLRNIGGDLGGAVKDFKQGMREGGEAAESKEDVKQVSGQTIDVQAKREDTKV